MYRVAHKRGQHVLRLVTLEVLIRSARNVARIDAILFLTLHHWADRNGSSRPSYVLLQMFFSLSTVITFSLVHSLPLLCSGRWNLWNFIFHKVAQRRVLGVVKSLIIVLSQIVRRACRWKNLENWSIVGKDVDKSLVARFSMDHGVHNMFISLPALERLMYSMQCAGYAGSEWSGYYDRSWHRLWSWVYITIVCNQYVTSYH